MKRREITLFKQTVPLDGVKEALNSCYENIAFSTFPYLSYHLSHSSHTLDKFHSGNCIAMTTFLKRFLRTNHKVQSFIVPASVPNLFRVQGTPDLCHVSLLIPITETRYYILDPAFYFLEPLYVDIVNPQPYVIDSMNIHKQEHENIIGQYDGQRCVCFFEKTPSDKWCYETYEVLDPDESIGIHFLTHKPEPFLCKTTVVDGIPYKDFHLKIEQGQLIFIQDHLEVYRGPPSMLPEHLQQVVEQQLFKYLRRLR
jgi:hypothetical protein